MLENLEIRTAEPVPGWAYEWVTAEATYAVDPNDASNAAITDLQLARRDHDGKVRYRGDVMLLRPTDGGNHRALLAVCNRGCVATPFTAELGIQGFARLPDLTDTTLLERGYTIVWGGWQWDVNRTASLAGLSVPVVHVEPGLVRSEVRVQQEQAELPLAALNPVMTFANYPTSDIHDPEAVLTVRTSQMGPREVVPRDRWRFTSPDAFALDGGFQPYRWYELLYRTSLGPVVGCGLLAIRDLAAHLRREHGFVFGYGISQTGRFLRQFVYDALNMDEKGAQVFDGLFINIASARRGEFNRRFAQPGLVDPLMPEYGPPYESSDLLASQRSVGCAPKLIITNSANEYWRGDGALVHQDAVTGSDVPEDPDVRVHLLSGTDHLGPIGAMKSHFSCANPTHNLDMNPVLRALFVQLDEWVTQGITPPGSRVPRASDGTITTRSHVLAKFPDAHTPDAAFLPYTPAIDSKSSTWPLSTGAHRVALVSAVDERGNEVAGIRLPEVEVGLAAYTGWNARKHIEGLPDLFVEMVGSRLDPLQIVGKDWELQVRKAAQRLVDDRFLLSRDVEQVVTNALQNARK